MLSFKRKLTKTLYRIGTIKLETWGGVASALLKKYLVLIYVTSIEIKQRYKPVGYFTFCIVTQFLKINDVTCMQSITNYELSYEPGTIV